MLKLRIKWRDTLYFRKKDGIEAETFKNAQYVYILGLTGTL